MMYYGQSITTGGGSEKPIDQILHERYFQNKTDGFFMEAGANDGVFISTCKFFEDIGWSGINIEPSKELFAKLVVNRPNAKNIMVALSDKRGTDIFEEVDVAHNGFSRMGNSATSAETTKRHGIQIRGVYPVQTITYQELISINDITEVDLFALDVEGYELQVIQGMWQTKVFPKVMCVEHAHIGIDNITVKLNEISGNTYMLDFNDPLNAIYVRK